MSPEQYSFLVSTIGKFLLFVVVCTLIDILTPNKSRNDND